MSVIDLSFSAVARDVVNVTWPSMLVSTVTFGAWTRRLRVGFPSPAEMGVAWLAAAISSLTLLTLLEWTGRSHANDDVDQQMFQYVLVEMVWPALLTFGLLQLIILARPRVDWLARMLVALSALAAGLVIAMWLWIVPLPSWLQFRLMVMVWTIGSVAPVMGYALSLPIWLTALRRRTLMARAAPPA